MPPKTGALVEVARDNIVSFTVMWMSVCVLHPVGIEILGNGQIPVISSKHSEASVLYLSCLWSGPLVTCKPCFRNCSKNYCIMMSCLLLLHTHVFVVSDKKI